MTDVTTEAVISELRRILFAECISVHQYTKARRFGIVSWFGRIRRPLVSNEVTTSEWTITRPQSGDDSPTAVMPSCDSSRKSSHFLSL